VVRKSGEVGNYGGGSWRKAWLLDHERRMAATAAAG
jgi:O6-methylguanine-DNA--protein-cysteine methyltransferase